jgi:hypoxanthine phosphoribosyltransferase
MKHLLSYSQFLAEGIRLGATGKPEIDFTSDNPDDVIKLTDAPEAGSISPRTGAKVSRYYGYVMDEVGEDSKNQLMHALKEDGAVSQAEINQLVAKTFPTALKNKKITHIFVAGSTSPLAVSIAESIKSQFFPKAKIIDILKKFYQTPIDMVDWEAYLRADRTTRKNFDSYLKKFVEEWNGPEALAWSQETGQPIWKWPKLKDYSDPVYQSPTPSFSGHIKKSLGLKSGSRGLIKAGHSIDSSIIDAISSAEADYEKLIKDRNYDIRIVSANSPKYLIVDDIMLGGTTLRGIVDELEKSLSSSRGLANAINSVSTYSLIKYKSDVPASTKRTDDEIKAREEKKKLDKEAEAKAYSKYISLFKDASNIARQLKKSVDQVLPQFIEKEIGREQLKPKDSQIEISADKVIDAAKKAGLY